MSNFFARLLKDEAGQSTTEYILILSVVVMIAMKFKDKFGTMMTSQVEKLGNQIDQGLQSQ